MHDVLALDATARANRGATVGLGVRKMRAYAKVGPTFWTGETGKALRRKGTDAVVTALYLVTSPHSNMLGLYYQPVMYMAHESGLGIEGASKGLAGCIDVGFCSYDEDTEMVFVHEMAAWQIAEELKATDKRCAGIQKDYDALPDNPFLSRFFDRYEIAFRLKRRRTFKGEMSEGGHGPYQAPPKPHRSQEQEQEQEQERHAPPKSRRPARASQTSLPADFEVSDRVKAWAAKGGFTQLEQHMDAFKLKAAAKGYVNADWDAAFMGAVRDDWAGLRNADKRNAGPAQRRSALHADEVFGAAA